MRSLLVSAWRSVVQGCVRVVGGAGVVVADGDGLLVGEVGGDSAAEVGVVDGFVEDAAA
ncbi:hypothetical protein O7620_01770 [Micromonospora sp. WMMD710]|nr:hypothetical protein [Micromonospora sp. WMMD710]MDG4756626.1 hypothetical protein [Micromonospora sp. WMMD710]